MLATSVAPGCRPRAASTDAASPPDGAVGALVADAAPAGDVEASLAALARAEDARAVASVTEAELTAKDVRVRRRAARALARIGGDAAADALAVRLADADPEVVVWSSYGLGWSCKGREEVTVKRLVARLASLEAGEGAGEGAGGNADASDAADAGGARALGTRDDARRALVRAVGRCGGDVGARALGGLARMGPLAEPVALAYGDLAHRAKALDEDAATHVLELLEGGSDRPPVAAALYPLARGDVPSGLRERARAAVRGALPSAGDAAPLGARALGRLGGERAAQELGALVKDRGLGVPVRAEAARQLGTLGTRGKEEGAAALDALVPAAGLAPASARAELAVLGALVAGAAPEPGADVGPRARAALGKLARLAADGLPPDLLERTSSLRCVAAGHASPGEPEGELVRRCALDGAANAEDARAEARLVALLARPVDTSARRALFRELATRAPLRVRELAVEATRTRRDLAFAAVSVLGEALRDPRAGLVAVAAEVVHARPDLVLGPTPAERRKGTDPKAPPPTGPAVQALDPAVASALGEALARPWPEDRFETRLAVLEAAAATAHPAAAAAVDAAACAANPVVRERGRKAQRALGRPLACAREPGPDPAPELASPALAEGTRVSLVTDGGTIVLRLAPELAPVAAARLVALARQGFYTGVRVHRVVPGFVFQLGDPEGDGYGGSGRSLRCETSPVPFRRGDVGMALAGRDTGSSQIFVTLARTPHLDGDYAWVGRAEGPLDAILAGDVVREVRVDE